MALDVAALGRKTFISQSGLSEVFDSDQEDRTDPGSNFKGHSEKKAGGCGIH